MIDLELLSYRRRPTATAGALTPGLPLYVARSRGRLGSEVRQMGQKVRIVDEVDGVGGSSQHCSRLADDGDRHARARGQRIPTRAELDALEVIFQELTSPDEAHLRRRDIEDWTPEVLTFSSQEGITFLEGWRRFELGWSVERLAKVSRVPMAVILAWEAPSPDLDLLDQAAESLGLPRELLDKTLADYPWLALQVSTGGKSEP